MPTLLVMLKNSNIDWKYECNMIWYDIIRTLPVQPYTQGKFDTAQLQSFVLPVVPPTLIGVCRLLQIFYIFQVTNLPISIQLLFFKIFYLSF